MKPTEWNNNETLQLWQTSHGECSGDVTRTYNTKTTVQARRVRDDDADNALIANQLRNNFTIWYMIGIKAKKIWF